MNLSSARRRRVVFAWIYGTAIVGLTVPLIPAVWAGRPLVLGLPPSLLWVIAWLVVIFGLVLWLYRTEPAEGSTRAGR
jgi:hypothetical protein